MFAKIIRINGIIVIVLFCAACVFFSIVERDFDLQPDSNLARILKFPGIFEDRFYDYRMRQTLKKDSFDKRVVLVEIDDESLQTPEIGRWPFTRKIWAKFMHKMDQYDAKVVGFDVFFSEPEKACDPNDSPDTQLAMSIKKFQEKPGRKVILPYSLNVDGHKTDREFAEVLDALYNFVSDTRVASNEFNLKVMSVSKDVFPIPELVATEAGLAHIESTSDSDGIYRHYQFVGNVDELYFPSFALQTYEFFTNDKTKLELLNIGAYHLKTKDGSIKLNAKGESKVRWFGDETAYPRIKLKDVLFSKDTKSLTELFKDNIVFVGSTAFGAHDFRHTPVNSQTPGIFFHMNVVSMLLNHTFFKSAADSTLFSWVILIVGTLIMVLIQIFGMPFLDLFVVNGLLIGLYYLDTYLLLPLGYETKLFFCLVSIAGCYSWNTFLNFHRSNKDKAFLKQAFGTYISPELIETMYKTGVPPKLGGNEGPLTAYFTDIAGFSTFSEKLTATQLVELLNEYLTAMTDILLSEGGTLDKYEGDAIIAFFGAPLPFEDHAVRAVRTAVKMQNKLADLRAKWKSEGTKWPEIVHNMRMRIGINSGSIVTGNMGSNQRMNYTMMGDSVNLAARLEAAAKQYGIFTQISSMTKEYLQDKFELRELDTIRVVGKSEPVTVFDVLGIKGECPEHVAKIGPEFLKGVTLYKSQKWDEAIAQFNVVVELEHQRYPELAGKKTNPSFIYIERCEEFKKVPPPPNWDGVYNLTEK